MESRIWMFFVALAGLSWGVYVPLIAQGGKLLKSSYGSFLCVGVAYFLIAVLYPLAIFWLRGKMPTWNATGITFATLAGVAGALGALCVIFATFEYRGPRIYVAPVIFGVAPLINTVVSLFWHPDKSPLHFSLPETSPHWTLYVGIILIGFGAALVLYSKESAESHAHAAKPTQVAAVSVPATHQ
jgi:drug/metabolite transporter (DMT)-like permease